MGQRALHDSAPLQARSPKRWWTSRGVVGSLVVILSMGASIYGWEVDKDALTEVILALLALISAVVSLVGRIRGTRPISSRLLPGGGPDDTGAGQRITY